MWQFASTCQFCGMFRSVFSLPAFEPADLEDAFVNGSPNTLLQQLHLKLLAPISNISAARLKSSVKYAIRYFFLQKMMMTLFYYLTFDYIVFQRLK